MIDQEEVTREKCWNDGITCLSCIGHAARSVASVCADMTADQSAQVFRRMFTASDCLLNEHAFQWAYAEADGQVQPLQSKKAGKPDQKKAA